MIREQKIVSIAVLTVLLYAFGLLLDSNFFLLPFPLFDLIFIIVFIQFLFWNRKLFKTYIWIYFSVAIIQVMYNPLTLGMTANDLQLEKIDDSLFIDGLKLMSKILLITTVVLWRFQRELKFSVLYILVFTIFIALGLISEFFWFTPLAPFLFAFLLRTYDRENPYRYLWFLQGVFDLFTVIMLLFVN